MLDIQETKNIGAYNSFAVQVNAKHWFEVNTLEALREIIHYNSTEIQEPILVLGGGSNLLFTKDYKGLVLQNNLKGIRVVAEDEEHVLVAVQGGENWHELVIWALDHDYYGIENLSLIPGTVGAAPIQNIGAYGVELKDVFVRLNAVQLETGEIQHFEHMDCKFAYRDSVFKQSLKGQYFITEVVLRLSKSAQPNIQYGAIQTVLNEMGVDKITPKAVSQAVIHIRQQKLPNPCQIGNAGSFFKNPIVSQRHYKLLQDDFPHMPAYVLEDGRVKIPAAWLIDQCGWKGKRVGDAGVHQKHALVLVNYGNATGKEIKDLAFDIIYDVKIRFNILLTPEVNIL
ncbi:MAG: UDP-N-acetylmuramate dehydrogenase [Saprospiraceae bacterium]|nr:UDP-N-acetylmuramate dehydrogenase [Saprospiraceae bacterium]